MVRSFKAVLAERKYKGAKPQDPETAADNEQSALDDPATFGNNQDYDYDTNEYDEEGYRDIRRASSRLKAAVGHESKGEKDIVKQGNSPDVTKVNKKPFAAFRAEANDVGHKTDIAEMDYAPKSDNLTNGTLRHKLHADSEHVKTMQHYSKRMKNNEAHHDDLASWHAARGEHDAAREHLAAASHFMHAARHYGNSENEGDHHDNRASTYHSMADYHAGEAERLSVSSLEGRTKLSKMKKALKEKMLEEGVSIPRSQQRPLKNSASHFMTSDHGSYVSVSHVDGKGDVYRVGTVAQNPIGKGYLAQRFSVKRGLGGVKPTHHETHVDAVKHLITHYKTNVLKESSNVFKEEHEQAKEAQRAVRYHEAMSTWHRSKKHTKAADAHEVAARHYELAASHFSKGDETKGEYHLDKAERHADNADDHTKQHGSEAQKKQNEMITKHVMSEETESLDEISKGMLGRYVKAAHNDIRVREYTLGQNVARDDHSTKASRNLGKIVRRSKRLRGAVDRLVRGDHD